MKKPNHYSVLKAAIENGTLESVRDIQLIVPITTLTQDMRLNYNTLSKRLLEPSRLTISDINRLATLIGIDSAELFRRILKEVKGRR